MVVLKMRVSFLNTFQDKKCVFFVLKIVQKGHLWDVCDVGFVLCMSGIP